MSTVKPSYTGPINSYNEAIRLQAKKEVKRHRAYLNELNKNPENQAAIYELSKNHRQIEKFRSSIYNEFKKREINYISVVESLQNIINLKNDNKLLIKTLKTPKDPAHYLNIFVITYNGESFETIDAIVHIMNSNFNRAFRYLYKHGVYYENRIDELQVIHAFTKNCLMQSKLTKEKNAEYLSFLDFTEDKIQTNIIRIRKIKILIQLFLLSYQNAIPNYFPLSFPAKLIAKQENHGTATAMPAIIHKTKNGRRPTSPFPPPGKLTLVKELEERF